MLNYTDSRPTLFQLQPYAVYFDLRMSSIVPRVDSLGEQPLVSDLAECLRQLDAIDVDVNNLIAGLNEERFHWSPAAARWSVAQCLVHLVIVGCRFLPIIDETTENARAD